MERLKKVRKALFSTLIFLLFFSAVFAGEVYYIEVDGVINPVTSEFIIDSLTRVNNADAECLIILLDTPGGLDENMRIIIKGIMSSSVPVIVFVSPSGSQAASAGTYITMSAHIAAMAPGTNIGAATPVMISQMSGKDAEVSPEMQKKLVNNSVAYLKSIAEDRGRNSDWVVLAVEEGKSISAEEAVKLNVVDILADNLEDLMNKLDNFPIKMKDREYSLQMKDKIPIEIKMNFKLRFLKILTNPNLAYLLFLLGMLGIYAEVSNPGSIFPGVVGGISIILALYSFNILPVNIAGVLLLILSFILFLLEIKVVSYGLLTIGGIVSLFFGSIFLMKPSVPFYQVSLGIIIPTVVITTVIAITLIYLAVKAQSRGILTADKGLLNEKGTVEKVISEGRYMISIHGEYWKAESSDDLKQGDSVRVIEVDNLLLKVEKS